MIGDRSAVVMVLMSDDEVAWFGKYSDAGFGALRTERGLLPLVAMDVDARVAGIVASIEVAQTFVNTTGAPIEATYIFPLPDRAAVHRFRMEIGGRVVEGVVEERGAARQQYDAAIQRGHQAAITEEERAGVFTLRVGNLMPNEAATVRISLVGPLAVDDGEVTFRFPLVVAERYIPGYGLGGAQAGLGVAGDTNLVPDASRISPPVLLPGCPNPVRLGLRVHLEDRNLREIGSSLHAVTSTLRDAVVIEVLPGERLDRDFILHWRIDGSELRSKLICSDDADGRGGSFMLTMVPPSTTSVAAKPRDVVFVIDRSGSMGGWKMVAARRAAARMIDSLTSRDRFCAIAFDNTVELMPDQTLSIASDRNRFRAVERLAKVDARGGTELADPLRRAVAMLVGGHDDRERVIVLVTDGQVGNEDHILRELVPALRNVRMFTLGIDQAVNAAFLRRLAGAGGGLCELVESEDRLDEVMAKVHRRIGTPIATDLSLRSVGLDLEGDSISPKKLPDVYAGAPVVILGRYRGSAPASAVIEVAGTSLGEPLDVHIARDPEANAAPWLAASWARANIRDLEDRYAVSAQPALERRVVEVSKRFGVLSRFTAFLAVDRERVVNYGGALHQVVQPVDRSGTNRNIMRSPAPGMMPGPSRNGPSRAPMSMPMPGPQYQRSAPPMAPQHRGDSDDFGEEAPSERMQAAFDQAESPPPRSRGYASPPPPPAARPPRPTESSPSRDYLGGDGPSETSAPPSHERLPMSPPRQPQGGGVNAGAAPQNAYLSTLGALGRELENQARGRCDASAIRVLRQRLTEWVEDVRSVGGNSDLAIAVEQLVKQLSLALAGGGDLASEALAIATVLATLSAGGTPPKPTRQAFWK